jgi:hypothetical protein
VGEEFAIECPACGGDTRLIAFITEPGPSRKILNHCGGPLEKPAVSPARGLATDWGALAQVHDGRAIFQASPVELPPAFPVPGVVHGGFQLIARSRAGAVCMFRSILSILLRRRKAAAAAIGAVAAG